MSRTGASPGVTTAYKGGVSHGADRFVTAVNVFSAGSLRCGANSSRNPLKERAMPRWSQMGSSRAGVDRDPHIGLVTPLLERMPRRWTIWKKRGCFPPVT